MVGVIKKLWSVGPHVEQQQGGPMVGLTFFEFRSVDWFAEEYRVQFHH